MTKKPLWAVVALAIAAAIIAFVTSMLSGCSVAIHGRLATWAATYQHEPPDVPAWGPTGRPPSTTRPSSRSDR